MRRLYIRGDTILWFYRDFDFDDGNHEHLVVAKLDDPDGVTTRKFHLDWDSVRNNLFSKWLRLIPRRVSS